MIKLLFVLFFFLGQWIFYENLPKDKQVESLEFIKRIPFIILAEVLFVLPLILLIATIKLYKEFFNIETTVFYTLSNICYTKIIKQWFIVIVLVLSIVLFGVFGLIAGNASKKMKIGYLNFCTNNLIFISFLFLILIAIGNMSSNEFSTSVTLLTSIQLTYFSSIVFTKKLKPLFDKITKIFC